MDVADLFWEENISASSQIEGFEVLEFDGLRPDVWEPHITHT